MAVAGREGRLAAACRFPDKIVGAVLLEVPTPRRVRDGHHGGVPASFWHAVEGFGEGEPCRPLALLPARRRVDANGFPEEIRLLPRDQGQLIWAQLSELDGTGVAVGLSGLRVRAVDGDQLAGALQLEVAGAAGVHAAATPEEPCMPGPAPDANGARSAEVLISHLAEDGGLADVVGVAVERDDTVPEHESDVCVGVTSGPYGGPELPRADAASLLCQADVGDARALQADAAPWRASRALSARAKALQRAQPVVCIGRVATLSDPVRALMVCQGIAGGRWRLIAAAAAMLLAGCTKPVQQDWRPPIIANNPDPVQFGIDFERCKDFATIATADDPLKWSELFAATVRGAVIGGAAGKGGT